MVKIKLSTRMLRNVGEHTESFRNPTLKGILALAGLQNITVNGEVGQRLGTFSLQVLRLWICFR